MQCTQMQRTRPAKLANSANSTMTAQCLSNPLQQCFRLTHSPSITYPPIMTTQNKLAEIATFVDIGIANAYIAMSSGLRANILVEYNQQAPKICAALDRHSAFLSLIDDGYQCVDQFFLDFRAELRSMGSAVEKLMLVREAKIRHLLPEEPFDMDVEMRILSAAHDEWTRARVDHSRALSTFLSIKDDQCKCQHVSGLSCFLKEHATEMDDKCISKLPSGEWVEWMAFGRNDDKLMKVVGQKKPVKWRVGAFGTNEASTKAILTTAFERYEFAKQRIDAAIVGTPIPTHMAPPPVDISKEAK